MINPGTIADELVTLLKAIPALVTLVGGNAANIYAYHDTYPERVDLRLAVRQMPSPGVMVAWTGTQPSGISTQFWKHEFSIFMRTAEEAKTSTPHGYYDMFRQVVKGIPAGQSLPIPYLTVDSNCEPMDTPAIHRQSGVEGLDFFEITLSFCEIGDS